MYPFPRRLMLEVFCAAAATCLVAVAFANLKEEAAAEQAPRPVTAEHAIAAPEVALPVPRAAAAAVAERSKPAGEPGSIRRSVASSLRPPKATERSAEVGSSMPDRRSGNVPTARVGREADIAAHPPAAVTPSPAMSVATTSGGKDGGAPRGLFALDARLVELPDPSVWLASARGVLKVVTTAGSTWLDRIIP